MLQQYDKAFQRLHKAHRDGLMNESQVEVSASNTTFLPVMSRLLKYTNAKLADKAGVNHVFLLPTFPIK